jgi:hypothetical protein
VLLYCVNQLIISGTNNDVCSEANQAKPYAERLIKFWDVLKDKALEDAEG